jgi:hypothetical protein
MKRCTVLCLLLLLLVTNESWAKKSNKTKIDLVKIDGNTNAVKEVDLLGPPVQRHDPG